MKTIIFAAIKQAWEKGQVVVAEVEVFGSRIERAIVQNISTKMRIKTAYGIAKPHCIYTFNNFSEAQRFVNETPKEN